MSITEADLLALQHRLAKNRKEVVVTEPAAPLPPAEHLPRCSADEAKLNKLEKKFLAHLRMLGYVPGIQNVTVKLADDCRLTPDFNYYDEEDKFILVDVKGYQREDALIKMKMAARQHARWVWRIARLEHGSWEYQELKP